MEMIVNRCLKPGCGMIVIYVNRRTPVQEVRAGTGSTPCVALRAHDFDPWGQADVNRDTLVLQAVWTVGRSVTPGLLSDPTSHVLADSLGWRHGDAAPLSSLPLWLCEDDRDLSWPGVMLAHRVAELTRDQWPIDDVRHALWQRVVAYLALWSDRAL
jgi:hypothetical protein